MSTTDKLELSENQKRNLAGREPYKFHPQASHVSPAYRDGWNDALDAVAKHATQWQPIETAPKDTQILGYWSNGEAHVGGIYGGNWLREMDATSWEMPTHWMPLLKP